MIQSLILLPVFIALLPALLFAAVALGSYRSATAPLPVEAETGLQAMGEEAAEASLPTEGGLAEPPTDDGALAEPPSDSGGLQEPPAEASAPGGCNGRTGRTARSQRIDGPGC